MIAIPILNPRSHKHMLTLLLPSDDTEFGEHCLQVVFDVAAVEFEYVLAGQIVHGTGPVWALYFPPSHAAHVNPLCPATSE
jgi:hypothetical protein